MNLRYTCFRRVDAFAGFLLIMSLISFLISRTLSFIGLALCLSIMLMTSVLFAAIAMGMALAMYKYIEYCG